MADWPAFLDFSGRQAFWTILVGAFCNSTCALLGCFLVLRRMSMLGDALSHAVLPGLVIAFILTSSTAPLPMFLGAAVFAMLTAAVSRLLTSLGHTTEESGLGISFTAFFALGILLIQLYAENVHLDRDAVLEGEILHVPLDTLEFMGLTWPVTFWTTGIVLAGVVLFLVLFWKEIKTATFDPVYASAIGLHGQFIMGSLIVLVAICVVAAFKVVGSILVVAMLVVPAASAQLVSQKLRNMLLCSVAFALAATVLGYAAAHHWNTSAAGMMAVMTGLGYAAALLFSPSQGVLVTRWRLKALQKQVHQEDLLGVLYRWQEQHGAMEHAMPLPSLRELAKGSYNQAAISQLVVSGLVKQVEKESLMLTEQGQQQARRIIRGHRLWESFLENEFVLPEDHLHESADRMEHFLDNESRRQIEESLGPLSADPHGKVIPPS